MVLAMNDDLPEPDYRANIVPFRSAPFTATSGGGGDGMEPRIARLEADVSYIKTRLDEATSSIRSTGDKVANLNTELAVLTERSSRFATKSYSVVTAAAIIGALSGLFLFADRLKVVLGIG